MHARLLHDLKEVISDYYYTLSYPQKITAIIPSLFLLLIPFLWRKTHLAAFPVQGYTSRIEPTIVLKYKFYLGSVKIITQAYNHVRDYVGGCLM